MTTLLEDARSAASAAVFADNWGLIEEAVTEARRSINLLETYISMHVKAPAHDNEPETRWSLRDEGRSDGYGESYGECNT